VDRNEPTSFGQFLLLQHSRTESDCAFETALDDDAEAEVKDWRDFFSLRGDRLAGNAFVNPHFASIATIVKYGQNSDDE